MTAPAWRYAFASVVGASHAKLALACQDASDCRVLETAGGDPVLVAVVSDGAGSASRAEVGARLACSLFTGEMAALLESGGGVRDMSREFVRRWLTRFQNEVALRAEADGLAPREFACTILAAAVAEDGAAFFQIGDGAIVTSSLDDPGEYCWVFWPQRGEYENTTSFATDATAAAALAYEFLPARIEELALFSDGMQRLALHFQSQTVHGPFFRAMFRPLDTDARGEMAGLSASLAAFLASPKVTDRTDDDKTLILATRRAPSAADEEGSHARGDPDDAARPR